MANQTPAHPPPLAHPTHPTQHPTPPASPAQRAPAHPAQQNPVQHDSTHHDPAKYDPAYGSKDARQKADPAAAQYVVNLTPEQFEAHLRQAEAKDAPPRPQIELGGTGTAKASFKDAAGGDVQITSTEWSATGPITIKANDRDPTSANIEATGLGPATVTVVASTADGSAQTSTDLMVISKIGAPVAGTIEISVQAPEQGKGGAPAQSVGQGSQVLPVPPTAPPKPGHSTVPPAQVMSQPSPQPQPQPDKTKQPPAKP